MRRQTDRLAPIRYIFDTFVENCKANYSASEYVTIDEMLLSFRGRCGFRQYITNKPLKYGLKVFSMVDSRTFYTYNMETYVGKQEYGPFKVSNSPGDVVERLITPISGIYRNVTCDNWFMSISLAQNLFIKHKLTVTGTLRKNK